MSSRLLAVLLALVVAVLAIAVVQRKSVEAPKPVVRGAETSEVERQSKEVAYDRFRRGPGRRFAELLPKLQGTEVVSLAYGPWPKVSIVGLAKDFEAISTLMASLPTPEPFEEVKLGSAESAGDRQKFVFHLKLSNQPINGAPSSQLAEHPELPEVLSELGTLARARGLEPSISAQKSSRDRWLVVTPLKVEARGELDRLVDFFAAVESGSRLLVVRDLDIRAGKSGYEARSVVAVYSKSE